VPGLHQRRHASCFALCCRPSCRSLHSVVPLLAHSPATLRSNGCHSTARVPLGRDRHRRHIDQGRDRLARRSQDVRAAYPVASTRMLSQGQAGCARRRAQDHRGRLAQRREGAEFHRHRREGHGNEGVRYVRASLPRSGACLQMTHILGMEPDHCLGRTSTLSTSAPRTPSTTRTRGMRSRRRRRSSAVRPRDPRTTDHMA
jgi:hypothetical protein